MATNGGFGLLETFCAGLTEVRRALALQAPISRTLDVAGVLRSEESETAPSMVRNGAWGVSADKTLWGETRVATQGFDESMRVSGRLSQTPRPLQLGPPVVNRLPIGRSPC